jgi:hypothetical protein
MPRPVQVFDGDGEYLGDFADWHVAHRWAHQRAVEPGTPLPVTVEDRAGRYGRQLWPNRCDLLTWLEPVRVPGTCMGYRTPGPGPPGG